MIELVTIRRSYNHDVCEFAIRIEIERISNRISLHFIKEFVHEKSVLLEWSIPEECNQIDEAMGKLQCIILFVVLLYKGKSILFRSSLSYIQLNDSSKNRI